MEYVRGDVHRATAAKLAKAVAALTAVAWNGSVGGTCVLCGAHPGFEPHEPACSMPELVGHVPPPANDDL